MGKFYDVSIKIMMMALATHFESFINYLKRADPCLKRVELCFSDIKGIERRQWNDIG